MQNDENYQILNRLSALSYRPTDNDLKELMQLIQKTGGSIILKIIKSDTSFQKINKYITERLTNLDKKFYSAFFTLIKQASKWEVPDQDLFIIVTIPKLISLHTLLNKKNDDRLQMVEVILYSLYTEYLDKMNIYLDMRNVDNQFNDFKHFPTIQINLKIDRIKGKRHDLFAPITQINPNNITKIYEFLVGLYLSKLMQFNGQFIEDFVQTSFILCGAQIPIEQLNNSIDYSGCQFSLFSVQISDQCLENLIFFALSIGSYYKQINYTSHLIDQLLKKSANESRYHIAGLAQSAKEITQNMYEGIF